MKIKYLLILIGLLIGSKIKAGGQYTGQTSYTLTIDTAIATNIQWYKSAANGTMTAISGASQLTYSASQTGVYYATYDLPSCTNQVSKVAYLTFDISKVTIDGGTNNTGSTFIWSYNASPIAGQTSSTLQPTQYGEYTVNTDGKTCNQFSPFAVYQLACTAGTTAPAITPTMASNTCPTATVDLSTLANTGTTPTGTTLIWSTHNTPTTAGDTLTSLSVSIAGKYYALYYDKVSNCYSPADSVVVTINVCNSGPCPLGSFSETQYAATSAGGWGGATSAAGAPDGNYHTAIYFAGYETRLTYNTAFVPGSDIVYSAKLNSGVGSGGLYFEFSSDNANWTSPTALLPASGITSTLTDYTYTIPTGLTDPSGSSEFKYIRISTNSIIEIDAVQAVNYFCKQLIPIVYLDNGAGGGTAGNCVKDGTETITASSGLYYNLVQNLNVKYSYPVSDGVYFSKIPDGNYSLVVTNSPTAIIPIAPGYTITNTTTNISVVNGVFTPSTLTNCIKANDTDGDGISDITDLDDDNDGILDTIECPALLETPIVTNGSFEAGFTGWSNVSNFWSVLPNPTGLDIAYNANDAASNNIFNQTIDLSQALVVSGYYTFNFKTFTNGAGNAIINSLTADLKISYNNTLFATISNPSGSPTATVTPSNGALVNISTFPIIDPSLSSELTDLNLKIPVASVPLTGVLEFSFDANGDDIGITGISVDKIPLDNPNLCDTDGDGIANYLDLDSDGDGCPDALEGGANLATSSLVTSSIAGGNSGAGYTGSSTSPVVKNLGNTVNTTVGSASYGVPNVAGTGQTVGNSANKLVQSANCGTCNAGTTAPSVSATTLSNTCPATTVNLNSLVTSTAPSGASLVWFTDSTHTGTAYATPTAATADTFYAFYHDAVNGCYSPADSVIVTINDCTDTDGDGILDSIDLDDDNDGILDKVEGNCLFTSQPFTISNTNNSYVFNNSYDWNTNAPDPYATTTIPTYGLPESTSLGKMMYENAQGAYSGQIDFTNGPLIDPVIEYKNIDFSKLSFFDVNDNPVTIVPVWVNTETAINGNEISDANNSTTHPNYYDGPADTGGLPERYTESADGYITIKGTFSSIKYAGVPNPASDGHPYRDGWYVNVYMYNCNLPDTDGDGIADKFDLDSDGDGCPDALEGGANLAATSLVTSSIAGGNSGAGYTGTSTSPVVKNLGNTVNTTVGSASYGVPTVAGTGQTVGNSADKLVQSANCVTCGAGTTAPIITQTTASNTCPTATADLSTMTNTGTQPAGTTLIWSTHTTPLAESDTLSNLTISTAGTYYALYYDKVNNCYSPADSVIVTIINCTDFDGDGILDTVDLDDDNDGILDLVECPVLVPPTVETITGPTAFGTVTYTPSSAAVQTLSALTNGSIADAINIIPANTGTPTVFTIPLVTPRDVNQFFLYNDAGAPGDALANFTVKLYDASNTLLTTLTAVGTNGVVKNQWDFPITAKNVTKMVFTTIYWWSHTNGNSQIREIALGYYDKSCDTDGDGIANSFDLDSDNDGCSDAFEAGATTNTTANYKFTGTVGTNGLDNSLETAADNGTVNYTVSYANATNASIKNCTDTDGDGIPDYIDLDDDNDGIVDTDESLPIQCIPIPFATFSTNVTLPTVPIAVNTNTPVSSTLAPGITFSLDVTAVSGTASSTFNEFETKSDGSIAAARGSGSLTYKLTFNNPVNLTIDELHSLAGQFSGTDNFIISVTSGNITYSDSGTPDLIINSYNSTSINIDGQVGDNNWDIKLNQVTSVTVQFNTTSGNNQGPLRFNYCTNDVLDTDNDGIANSLDLDSDGDGCPDAIEGGANFAATSLVTSTMAGGNSGAGYTGTSTSPVVKNLGNTVNTTVGNASYGVPTVAGTGQTVGNSANGAVQSPNCVTCANPSVGGTAAYTGGTICSTSNMGTITLTGQTGDVVKWQTSTNGGTSWTDIANTATKNSYTFINAANNQQYRAVINTGGVSCADATSTVVTITTSAAACTASSCTYSSDTFSPQISTNTSANYTTHVILINPTDGLIKYVTAAGSTSFTGVVPGDYVMYAVTYDNTMSPTPTLTVGTNITALAGCFAVSDPSVTKVCCPTIAPATVSVTAQPDCSTATGTISITAPTGVGMTYSIDGSTYTNTTGIFTGVAAGTYTIRAKDANGCVTSDTSVTVTAQPPVPAAPTLSIQQPTCSVATGTITVTAPTGAGLTYSINGLDYSNTTGVFAGLYEDFYNVTAKNSAGCVSNVTLGTINPQPQTPTILAVSKTNPLEGNCPITNTGTITVVGGGSNLQYSIDAGATWQSFGTFTSLNGGTYTVRIGNSVSGCYIETTVVLPAANCIEICTDGIDNDGDNLVDCNDSDCMNATIATISADKTVICTTGSTATLTASGGNTYLWSTGATTATINVATAGKYSVTATRGTGCTDTASMIISTPSVDALCGKTEICPGVNGATIEAHGGTSFLWSTGATSSSIYASAAGTYSVTITGQDGCTQPLSYVITAKTPITVQCDERPIYRLALGKSPWSGETYTWQSLNGIPIVSHSTPLDTSITVDLSTARLDSVYKFIQIATRFGLQDTDCIALKIIDCNIKPVVTVTPQTVIEDTPKQICLPFTDPNVGQTHTVVANCAPQHGTATTPSIVAGQICFTYTPVANYNGPDTVCLILCDNDLNVPKCDTVKVPITVTPVNDKPDLVIVTPVPVSPDSTSTICGTVTDVDLTDTHTTTIICGPSHGTATPLPIVNGQVCFRYTPNGTFNGTDTVCVVVCDNGTPSLCDTVKVVLQATAKPVAINDFNTTLRNTPVTGTVATNDKSNGFAVEFTPISTSPNGTLIMSPDGSYLFTPMYNFVGQVDYWYTECNAANVCDTAKLSITVYAPTPLNDAPIANDDVIQTNKNLPVTGYVTSNDFDPDGDPLRVNPTPVTNPLHGTILLNPNGSYTYTPALNFVGKDSFEYVVCDLLNICDVAKVVIYITEDGNGVLVNDKPNAQDDLAATPMNVPVTGSMRLNDSDPNAPNTTLVYNTTPLSNPTNGTVTLTANGNYTYTPTPGFFGNDEFKYVVCDAQGLCDTATVVVKVIPAVPDALNDIIATVKNTPISGSLTTNDQGNGLPYVLNTTPVQQPTNGTITILPNGTYTYTPNPGFVGDDVVKYVICNDAGVCDTASLTITVQDNPIVGVNNPPVAKNDVIETFKNTQTAGTVLGNDFDIDGDPIVATIAPVDPPAHGTLILNVNGAYTYLPDPDYTGRDSFQYQICDNKAACTTAWAFIEVRNDINGTANDKPNAEDDAVTTMMGIPVSSSMKPNDSDPNNNTLTYQTTPVANVAHGTVTINANGSYTYTPAAGYSGTDQFKYAVCDNGTPSLCDTATVYIVVPNHKPSVVDSVIATTPKDSVITVCTTITEVDSTDILAATLVCSPQHGTATPSVNGKQLCVTYTPAAGYLGTDSVCVKVCDAAGLCDTVKFKFTVNQTCVNISLKVFLEGPFNTTTNLMNTTLNQRGLLPGQTPIGAFAIPTPAGQPYSGAPWNYTGSETVTNYAPTVVDWVLVSFRTSPVLGATVFRAAGLLHNDGTITFPSPCINLPTGSFYVVIEHRNHMGIMSPNAVPVVNNTMNFDFTTGQSFVLTNPPSFGQKVKSTAWMMYAGDGKKNTTVTNYDINFSDSQLWKLESGIFDQYRYGDFNMDADVNFNDSNLWKLNNGRYSGVPH